jgi:lipoprotein-anchoring transpeptidase ErfK/SrfK
MRVAADDQGYRAERGVFEFLDCGEEGIEIQMRDDHGRRVGIAVAVALLAAGCGAQHTTNVRHVLAAKATRCTNGGEKRLGSDAKAYVGVAPNGAVAYRSPGGAVTKRFGKVNVNGYPTVFLILGAAVRPDCKPQWYRVELPVRPNGSQGWVRAASLQVQTVDTRIVVDLSRRELTLFRGGKPALRSTVAIGSPATPTPIGRYYVNQRLVPENASGPYGPAAIGVSAFSNVLTGWAQGGPIGIHGTNEPWSIGHDVSNGCIRLPNPTLSRLFKVAVAGTPVIIHP